MLPLPSTCTRSWQGRDEPGRVWHYLGVKLRRDRDRPGFGPTRQNLLCSHVGSDVAKGFDRAIVLVDKDSPLLGTRHSESLGVSDRDAVNFASTVPLIAGAVVGAAVTVVTAALLAEVVAVAAVSRLRVLCCGIRSSR